MNAQWHLFTEKTPPEEEVLLVIGPLGIDLAMLLENNLYFKKGDDWTSGNLEHWRYNMPTQWSELTLPDEDSDCGKITPVTSGKPSFRNDSLAPPVLEIPGRLTHPCL